MEQVCLSESEESNGALRITVRVAVSAKESVAPPAAPRADAALPALLLDPILERVVLKAEMAGGFVAVVFGHRRARAKV